MPRIRTIKPEFWTDEALTECSMSARLMFIGMLNFADDNGNIERSSKQLKMRIFPADNIDCEVLLSELLTHGILTEYSVIEKKYIHIKGFRKHQVINRPSNTNIPKMEISDDSLSTHGVLPAGREGKGRERKEKTGSDEPSHVTTKKSKTTTLKTYIAECKESGVDPISLDSIAFKNADQMGIPSNIIDVCWFQFKTFWIERKPRSGKVDWVATFNECVKGGGYGCYAKNQNDEFYLTTKGKNTLKLMESANG